MNYASYTIVNIIAAIMLLLGLTTEVMQSQTHSNFEFSLGIDYSAAEQTLDFFDHRIGNTDRVAKLRFPTPAPCETPRARSCGLLPIER